MDAPQRFDDSIEALINLVYLIRQSLDDPAEASTYLDLADNALIDITANQSVESKKLGHRSFLCWSGVSRGQVTVGLDRVLKHLPVLRCAEWFATACQQPPASGRIAGPVYMKPQSFTASTAEIDGEHLVLKNSRAKLVAMLLSEIVESWSELPAHLRSSAAS
jgi:hypothetical protein